MDKLEELKRRLAAKSQAAAAAKAGEAAATAVTTTTLAAPHGTFLPPTTTALPYLPPTFRPDPNVLPSYRDEKPLTHMTSTMLVDRYIKNSIGGPEGNTGAKNPGYIVLGSDTSRKLVDIDEAYESKGTLGSGVYGTVYAGAAIDAAKDGKPQPLRALKQIKGEWLSQSQVGMPAYLLREFDVLMRLRHPNIVRGLEMGHAKGDKGDPSVYLVTDHGGTNLKSFLYAREAYLHLGSRNVHPMAPQALLSKLKCIAKQLLSGLAYLHSHCVVHRDLKTSNLLIDSKGVVRICDFGLSRFLQEGALLTPGVCTLMYRAPELHFGIHDYGTKIDVWSAACIITELFLKAPLFPADTEAQHFQAVCDTMGVPGDKVEFKGLYHLKQAVAMLRELKPTVQVNGASSPCGGGVKGALGRSIMRGARECADDGLVDMLQSMLKWNPAERPTAEQLLDHSWFHTNPLPCEPAELLWALPFSKADVGGTSPTHAPAVASPLSLGKKRERSEGGGGGGDGVVGDSTPEGADGDEACAGATADTPRADMGEARRLMSHYQDESAEPQQQGPPPSDANNNEAAVTSPLDVVTL